MVAIDRRRGSLANPSTDCLDGVVIMIASAVCRRTDVPLKCTTYLWVGNTMSLCIGVLRDSVSVSVYALVRSGCALSTLWPTLWFSEEDCKSL